MARALARHGPDDRRRRADRADRLPLEDPAQREREDARRSARELPELDHNEIVGWEGVGDLGPFSAVFLDDEDLHPRMPLADRADRVAARAQRVGDLPGRDARAERRSSGCSRSCCSGDLVSLYVAVLRGIDPTPVTVIERLKAQLAER